MDYQSEGKKVIQIEREALDSLEQQIDASFDAACQMIRDCRGRVVVVGMGKSAHIGGKIAATLASTGTPAFCVNAGEASHGDLGMITKDDVVLAISFSGNTAEVVALLPRMEKLGVPIISITGHHASTLAQRANIHLDINLSREACPLGLAPTASTTATLALGDAIAIALLTARGFTEEDFAFSHPGGSLGKQMLSKVKNLMHSKGDLPSVLPSASLKETLKEMTDKSLGMTTVMAQNSKKLLGIFTDGDIRRCYEKGLLHDDTPVEKVMTENPKRVHIDDLAVKALNIMEKFKITSLVVVDDQGDAAGIIHMHDILQALNQ